MSTAEAGSKEGKDFFDSLPLPIRVHTDTHAAFDRCRLHGQARMLNAQAIDTGLTENNTVRTGRAI